MRKEDLEKFYALTTTYFGNPIAKDLLGDIVIPFYTSPEYINIMRQFILLYQPKTFIEIGTGDYGVTTAILALTMQQIGKGRIVTVDIEESEKRHELWDHLSVRGVIQEVHMSSEDYANIAPAFAQIFIDGNHTVEGFKKDFEAYMTKLNPGGYMFIHDLSHPGPDSYCNEVKNGSVPFPYYHIPLFKENSVGDYGLWIIYKP